MRSARAGRAAHADRVRRRRLRISRIRPVRSPAQEPPDRWWLSPRRRPTAMRPPTPHRRPPAAVTFSEGSRPADVVSSPSPAAPPASIRSRTEPSETLSPTVTASSRTTPATGAGTSIVALSLSRVTRGSSVRIRSPTSTRISMIGTSEKSPMSGTRTSVSSVTIASSSSRPGIRQLRVDAVSVDRAGDHLGSDLPFVGQRLQRGDRHVEPVDLEEPPQARSHVAAPETVGAEGDEPAVHPGPDLVGEQAHVVRRRHRRAGALLETPLEVAPPGLLGGVQPVPPLHRHSVAAQLGEARGAPHVGVHREVIIEEIRGGDHLAQDGAAAKELNPRAPVPGLLRRCSLA